MATILGAGAFMAAAAGLCWLMAIMDRRRDWRGRMVHQIKARGGKWNF